MTIIGDNFTRTTPSICLLHGQPRYKGNLQNCCYWSRPLVRGEQTTAAGRGGTGNGGHTRGQRRRCVLCVAKHSAQSPCQEGPHEKKYKKPYSLPTQSYKTNNTTCAYLWPDRLRQRSPHSHDHAASTITPTPSPTPLLQTANSIPRNAAEQSEQPEPAPATRLHLSIAVVVNFPLPPRHRVFPPILPEAPTLLWRRTPRRRSRRRR